MHAPVATRRTKLLHETQWRVRTTFFRSPLKRFFFRFCSRRPFVTWNGLSVPYSRGRRAVATVLPWNCRSYLKPWKIRMHFLHKAIRNFTPCLLRSLVRCRVCVRTKATLVAAKSALCEYIYKPHNVESLHSRFTAPIRREEITLNSHFLITLLLFFNFTF